MENEEEGSSGEEAQIIDEAEQVAAGVEQDIESLKKAVDEEREKAERYLANWQRAQADLVNYKKRVEQDKGEAIKFANVTLIRNLLPVLDDFERAFNSIPAQLSGLTWIDGIGLIHRKLQAILEAQGVSQIKARGEIFDPALHEAVMYGEGEEGKVITEFQKGYKLYDRLIRPALVMVGKGEEEKKETVEE
jgi:molecular chaperone GrpE